ncbi:hypothetical protein Ocin01_13351 [Orchesella cincta]|uniref:Apolipoprotein D n=1 Tax=Orchesella cincta TaxID=48709 RepID=A0A1D2MJZ2_ORCCI|nr:hypothetical protein Ocin01_13351 [Orchesella cincta]
MNSLLFSIGIFVTLLISTIQCLDLERAKEQPCFNIKRTVPLNTDDWMPDTKQCIHPMSRLDLYRAAADLLQKDPAEISESELDNACILYKSKNETYVTEGFGGRTREYTVNSKDNTMREYTIRPLKGEGYSGTVYTTFTDYKTFYFTTSCLDDGQMTWGVASITPTLPRLTVRLIQAYALSLGFKSEFFTELNYDQCNIQKDI